MSSKIINYEYKNDLASKLLEVRGLKTYFHTYWGKVKAVNDVSFDVRKGDFLGLVGESGSGKSVTARSILRLIQPPGKIVSGQILFEGQDLLNLSNIEMRRIMGRKIAMIFQSPRSSLNPLFTIGQQMGMIYQNRWGISRRKAYQEATRMLIKVGLAGSKRTLSSYPHELSSGMCQRIMIAMALSNCPDLLIADEPTTGLDVTLQAQIIDLLREQVLDGGDNNQTSCLIITHDLGVIAEICNRVVVIYAGKIVEIADVVTLFEKPLHPYTIGLLKATLRVDIEKKLYVLRGNVPNLISLGSSGCVFFDRCDQRMEVCQYVTPPEVDFGGSHKVYCHLYASGSLKKENNGELNYT